jgi:predicted Zn-dependent protease with MMP-like domain
LEHDAEARLEGIDPKRDHANPAPTGKKNSAKIRPLRPLGARAIVLYGGVMPVFTNPRRTPCFSTAPTQEDFEAIAAEALATIPEEFRRHVGNVRIQIDDFPSDEVEQEMELDTPFDLLGLYQGVSMMERGAGHVANDIDRIFLYRRPILDYWCESGEDLPHIVRHVLIHEIGHHFGLSDDDMEAIEAKAEEESRRAQPGA